jgi:hypothetical protein
MRYLSFWLILLLIAVASTSYAVGLLDSDSEVQAPIRKGEKPVIPLDTKDPSFNAWQQLRDFSKDPKREPGPINVQKYEFGWSWFGIPTFFHLPVALTPEDLKAGKVEVAIMGAYTDMSSGMRGAQHGPNAFRNSEVYGGWGVVELPNMHVMIDPFKKLTMVDYGDAPIDMMSKERSIHAIRGFVRQAVEVEYAPGKHVMPIIIGGDHSLIILAPTGYSLFKEQGGVTGSAFLVGTVLAVMKQRDEHVAHSQKTQLLFSAPPAFCGQPHRFSVDRSVRAFISTPTMLPRLPFLTLTLQT